MPKGCKPKDIRRASTLLNRDETIKRFGVEVFLGAGACGFSMGGTYGEKIDPEWLFLMGVHANLSVQYGPTDHFSSINGIHSGTYLCEVESVGNVALETAVSGPLEQSRYIATARLRISSGKFSRADADHAGALDQHMIGFGERGPASGESHNYQAGSPVQAAH